MTPPALDPERTRWVQNKSSRHGAKVDTIVLHITVSKNVAGLADLDSLLDWAANPASQISFHVANDREGHDARCVRDEDKAWACMGYNARSVNLEQVENDVNRTREQWLTGSAKQLENTAAWVAYWSDKFGIALSHRVGNGVCEHKDLGALGGGHVDCGPHYPIDHVISRAAVIRKAKYGH